MACFNRVIAAHPDDLDALYYRAFVQFTVNGDLDQAIKDLRRVADRDPNQPSAGCSWQKSMLCRGISASACNEYEAVIQRTPIRSKTASPTENAAVPGQSVPEAFAE